MYLIKHLQEYLIRYLQKWRVLGDGFSILFWIDQWLQEGKLCNLFSRLFALEIDKDCTVKQRVASSINSPLLPGIGDIHPAVEKQENWILSCHSSTQLLLKPSDLIIGPLFSQPLPLSLSRNSLWNWIWRMLSSATTRLFRTLSPS